MSGFAALEGKYEIFDWRNASAILQAVHAEKASDIIDVLGRFTLNHSALSVGGGNKSLIPKFIDTNPYALGWVEKVFDTKFVVDGVEYPSPTHSVDCVNGRVALKVEWDNKDPLFLIAISTTFDCSATCVSSTSV